MFHNHMARTGSQGLYNVDAELYQSMMFRRELMYFISCITFQGSADKFCIPIADKNSHNLDLNRYIY